MFYAYVIQSLLDSDYYCKGHCADLDLRLKDHNQLKTKSNKHKAPFKMFYFEIFDTIEVAVKREKYFKSSAGRRYLKKVMGKEQQSKKINSDRKVSKL